MEKKCARVYQLMEKIKFCYMCRLSEEKLDFPNYKLDIEKLKSFGKKTDQSWKIVVRLHPRMQEFVGKGLYR